MLRFTCVTVEMIREPWGRVRKPLPELLQQRSREDPRLKRGPEPAAPKLEQPGADARGGDHLAGQGCKPGVVQHQHAAVSAANRGRQPLALVRVTGKLGVGRSLGLENPPR